MADPGSADGRRHPDLPEPGDLDHLGGLRRRSRHAPVVGRSHRQLRAAPLVRRRPGGTADAAPPAPAAAHRPGADPRPLRHHVTGRTDRGLSGSGGVGLGGTRVAGDPRRREGRPRGQHHHLRGRPCETVTTVGYGDRYPVTGQGRAVAVVLMLVGIGLIGSVTATVAATILARVQTESHRS
ncbi:hypothetical protein C0Z10_02890 [Acidipropionibacterium jensenii]|uniref:Potassium channel domain-containing protein n=1 Tax=Acidipropionibacterium jensenii TaxID=1749 RepID=A0A3T0RXA7_9ACTN|nr:hypothetical protein C0Z10_02890 [Acidipropionibacterium jensenii]